jgi:hypothetical protein
MALYLKNFHLVLFEPVSIRVRARVAAESYQRSILSFHSSGPLRMNRCCERNTAVASNMPICPFVLRTSSSLIAGVR